MERNELTKVVITSSLITFFVILILGVGGYFAYTKFISPWFHNFQTNQQANSILNSVGKVVLLPPDEKPQVTTIINAEELRVGNPFFEMAKDGDAAIFYPVSGIIILFDLKNNKLLNMGIIATSTVGGTTTP